MLVERQGRCCGVRSGGQIRRCTGASPPGIHVTGRQDGDCIRKAYPQGCYQVARFDPTSPLPAKENYCDECRLCMSSCASGLMHPDEKTSVTMGGVIFSYSRRQSYNRCDYVCGGFTGLSKSGKWSTWSPARFPIPEKDEEFLDAIRATIKPYAYRPKPGIGFYHALLPGKKGQMTCGHCQLVCHPDKDVRAKRFKMLTEAGVVIQLEDGSLKAVSPEEARQHLAAMSQETRSFYERERRV